MIRSLFAIVLALAFSTGCSVRRFAVNKVGDATAHSGPIRRATAMRARARRLYLRARN